MEKKEITEQDYQDLQFREQKYWSLFKREDDVEKKVGYLADWRKMRERIYEIKHKYVLPDNLR